MESHQIKQQQEQKLHISSDRKKQSKRWTWKNCPIFLASFFSPFHSTKAMIIIIIQSNRCHGLIHGQFDIWLMISCSINLLLLLSYFFFFEKPSEASHQILASTFRRKKQQNHAKQLLLCNCCDLCKPLKPFALFIDRTPPRPVT